MESKKPSEINRREALKTLAKLSAYSAPTITTLLSPTLSHAQGSGVPVNRCGNRLNRNPNNPTYPNAANEGGNGRGVNLPNTVADCGKAGNTANTPI